MSITGKLSNFVCDTSYSDLQPKVIQDTKECLIDILSGTLVGAAYPDVKGITQEFKKYDRENTSSVWGTSERMSLLNAIILNGTMSHATEMDDVHKIAKTHAGAVVVPAALTLGEFLHSSGENILLATALGYEVALRIGMGIGATSHRLQGWHATGTCGIFGSAAAAAVLLKLDSVRTMSALGLAGTQASGLWAFTEDGASCKKFHAGKAAHGGVLAAILAAGGMTGPRCILEAEDGGLFPASSDEYDYELVTKNLGEVWEILNVDRKPFSCCRSAHPPIDAILQLQKEVGLAPDQIENIEVETYEVAVKQCCFTNTPKNVSEAQFCIPYGVAVALFDKGAALAQFTTERIQDPAVLALAQKVKVYASPRFSNQYPQNWGCELTVHTKDGQVFTKHITNAKGDHDNPLSLDDLIAKFKSLAGQKYTDEQGNTIINTLLNLEKLSDASHLTKLFVR